jgi:hypothetical protein
VLLLAVTAYLGARTFVFPGVPVLLGGDQGYFWMYAERMLRGERVYRDFFQLTPPGTDVVYLVAFALFGARSWVANAVVVALGVALGGLCFRLARGLMTDAEAALATAIFTVLVYGHALDATHHWFSLLAILGALSVLSPRSTSPRCALAGCLTGVATFFTQTHGVAALVAILGFFVWEARREGLPRVELLTRATWLVAGFTAALVAAGAYFVVTTGPGPIASCVFVYVWRDMPRSSLDGTFGLPETLRWRSLPRLASYLVVYAMVPVGYGLTRPPRVTAGGSPDRAFARLHALTWIIGVALLVEVAVYFAWSRLFAVCMPAVILFVPTFGRARSAGRWIRIAAWCGIVGLACSFLRSTWSHHSVGVDLPGGRVATTAANQEKLPWLVGHVPADDGLFVANRPSLYLALRRHDPVFLDAVQAGGFTTPEQVKRTMAELDAYRVAFILWSPELDEIAPGEPDRGLLPLRAYLEEHYVLVHTFVDGDEAWQRK